MTDPDNVSRRMAETFEPPPTVAAPVDPELPSEVADRIRELIRAGDLEAAAELSRVALEELGLETGDGP